VGGLMEWFNSHTRRYVEAMSERERRHDQEREEPQETRQLATPMALFSYLETRDSCIYVDS
jgi:hypothetical protein